MSGLRQSLPAFRFSGPGGEDVTAAVLRGAAAAAGLPEGYISAETDVFHTTGALCLPPGSLRAVAGCGGVPRDVEGCRGVWRGAEGLRLLPTSLHPCRAVLLILFTLLVYQPCCACCAPPTGGGAERMACDMGVPFLGRVPMDGQLSRASEEGRSVFEGGAAAAASSAPALRAIIDRLVSACGEGALPP